MKIRDKILPVILILVLAGWAVRWYIHKTFPPAMSFNSNRLITVDDNLKTTIDDYKGSVVIVSCFQTWCRDCARETPVLNQLANNLNSEKFRIIYITDEGNEKLSSFRTRLPSDRILFTWSAKSLTSLGIQVYPTTYLLDKSGRVVTTKLEGYDWLLKENAIRKLIAE